MSINDFTTHDVNEYANQWSRLYQGVYRANFYIEQDALDRVVWSSEEIRKKYLGEAHFMRAFFYLDLARMFGHIPMPLTTVSENLPQVAPEALYGQIASDIKKSDRTITAG
ncbi:MAG: RagB/SusD family nutrient uptake outer membrane protein [Tannerellaceae bacterium]|nr:RagB/SusD family nutrient uptake outer membrane protein [Tannerellaceae bacterium]